MVDLVLKNSTTSRTWGPAFVQRVVNATEPYLKIPRGHTGELGVVFVGPTKIRTLNRTWRHKDKPTDVLSFALPMRPIAGYTALSLGDLFICPAVVREKAKAAGTPVRDQMTWTIVHGLLHLAGYDHERSSRAAATMSALEQKILKKLS